MNVLTIKAKAALTANSISILVHKWLDKKNLPVGNNGSKELFVQALNDTICMNFIADLKQPSKYTVAAFSGILGCGVFPIGSLKPVCIIPPQAPAHLKGLSKEKLIDGHLGDIKLETERIARIICAALNEA